MTTDQRNISRRTAVLGLTALTLRPARADDRPVSPIARGTLAQNSLAQAFEPARGELPDLYLWGPNGKYRISELKGRTILMPLWAEWCAPCFSELPDFARLQQKYGNEKFAVVPVLTATRKRITPELLKPLLSMSHAGVFEPLIEDNRGDRLVKAMGRRAGGEYALPCNLLLAPDGRVVAREMGRISNSDDTAPAKTYKETLDRVGANAVQSRWGQADGEAFAAAMADGFLACNYSAAGLCR
jgi:thiol-disulfide isomerase/thioredoxin